MSVGTGNANAVRSGWDQQFDPASGWVTVETWKGTKAQIAAIAPIFRGAGAKTGVSNDGALWTLVATWSVELSENLNSATPAGAKYVGEVPTETWNVNIELVQVDLRGAAGVRALFANATKEERDEWIADAFSLAEDAIKARETPVEYLASRVLPPIPDSYLLDYMKIYRLKVRGVNAIEEKRPILSRNRSYSAIYEDPIQVYGADVIYTTAKLIRQFDVPPLIQRKLPANPPVTLTEARWGWKQRRQDGSYDASRGRIQESSDWVFAQWSDVIYSFLE
jgi:hypothetical protein